MKKTILCVILAFVVAGCEPDEYYMEGRVTTSAAAEVTQQSAILSGSVEIAHSGNETEAEIKSRGFVLGTAPNDLTLTVEDKLSVEGSFTCKAERLQPNTKYYARAYAAIYYKTSEYSSDDVTSTFYGNTVEFTTVE
jgi:hypothetical protein